MSDYIGEHPEHGFEEYETVDTLTKILTARGFTVEKGVAGLETAFEATWTSPAGADGPALGIIVEYDALRGTTEDYHGCQHNAQSPVGFAAAFALAEYMAEHGKAGSIRTLRHAGRGDGAARQGHHAPGRRLRRCRRSSSGATAQGRPAATRPASASAA